MPLLSRRLWLGSALAAGADAASGAPSLAVTMDDLNFAMLPNPEEGGERILAATSRHKARFGLFVIARNAESPTGQTLLRAWARAGHLIGNHTYSHRPYSALSFEDFAADVQRADTATRP